VHYRVWFFYWGASPGTSGTLNDISISYVGSSKQPDLWLPQPITNNGGSIQLGDKVFGSQSLKIEGNGTNRRISQQISLEPDTDYILQARIKTVGNSVGQVYLSDTQLGAAVLSVPSAAADQEWMIHTSEPWFSGARSTVWVHCIVTGATGTSALFDGLKLERGSVASPWSPGLVGAAATIDATGLQVDGSVGGILRLRGSSGVVTELDEVVSASGSGTSFPSAPITNQRFYRTDHGMGYYWDGTRWLCVCPHTLMSSKAGTLTDAFATITDGRLPHPGFATSRDILIVRQVAQFYVFNTGGSGYDASHYWRCEFWEWEGNSAILSTFVGTGPGAGGLNTINIIGTTATALVPYYREALTFTMVKIGTPHNIADAGAIAMYRFVG
jgi:hypothetical protein